MKLRLASLTSVDIKVSYRPVLSSLGDFFGCSSKVCPYTSTRRFHHKLPLANVNKCFGRSFVRLSLLLSPQAPLLKLSP
jgi:hypothetical protein